MASGKHEYLSQTQLNFIFNGGTWSAPGTLYIALLTVEASVSSKGTEATGSGYARITTTSNTTNWPTISGSTTTITNNVAQSFATATGTWSSGSNMVGAGIFDSLTSGGSNNLYYWGDLTVAKPVINGDTASFAIGAITVQEL
jgi:hypothetical protein